MKKLNELEALFNKAKGNNKYYKFDDFLSDIKDYQKIMRSNNARTVCSIKVNKSGMTRHFNFDCFNMLFNICYNEKLSWDSVKISGCGMDMHWYLKYRTCEQLFTKKEIEKYNMNGKCSSGVIL